MDRHELAIGKSVKRIKMNVNNEEILKLSNKAIILTTALETKKAFKKLSPEVQNYYLEVKEIAESIQNEYKSHNR
ncbi:MAG: hypothetical protein AB1349_11690 [Elusimicrobiota bacterium]